MNDLQLYVKIAMAVLHGLQCECQKYDCCFTTCKLYNKSNGKCYLRACPCEYDLETIENAITEIIQEEMDGEKND